MSATDETQKPEDDKFNLYSDNEEWSEDDEEAWQDQVAANQAAETTEAEEDKTDKGDGGADDGVDDGKMIPLAAAMEDRRKRQAAEQETAALRKQMEDERRVGDERLQQLFGLMEKQQAPKDPAVENDPEPDPAVDWAGHMEWQNRQMREQLTELQSVINAAAKSSAKQDEDSQLRASVQQDITARAAEDPDYKDAQRFIAQVRLKMHRANGYNQQQAEDLLAQDGAFMARRAAETGKRYSDLVKAQAVAAGWVKKEPSNNPPLPNAAPSADLQRIAQGQAEADAATGGSGQLSQGLTYSQILDMPQDEFHRLVVNKFGGDEDKLWKSAKQ